MSFYASGGEVTVSTTATSAKDASVALTADGGWVISLVADDTAVKSAFYSSGGAQSSVVDMTLLSGARANTETLVMGDGATIVVSSLMAGGWVQSFAVRNLSGDLSGYLTSQAQQNWPISPQVAALSGTDWVQLTEISGSTGGYSAVGWGTSSLFVMQTNGESFDGDVDIATLSNGNFVVAWLEKNGASTQLRFDVLSGADGTSVASSPVWTDPAYDIVKETAVTAVTGGAFFITSLYTHSGAVAPDQLVIQFFHENGTPGTVTAQPVFGMSDLDTILLSDGRLLLTWTDTSGADGSGAAVMAQVFNTDGTFSGTPFRLNSTTDGDQQDVDVAALANDGFIATWEDLSSGTSEVKYQTFNPNAAPADVALSTATVAEYAANGTTIGTLSATDEATGALAYSLIDDAGGRFVLDGATLKVANGVALDFEQATSHSVTVRATDEWGATIDQQFTLTVTDRNPENVTGTASGETIFGGSEADTLRGMGGGDTLHGGGGNDLLDGGADGDDMSGGTGSDVYKVDSLSDIVREAAGAANGTQDTVVSSVTFRLDTTTTAQGIEHIALTGRSSAAAIGSSTFNVLAGNEGNNYLAGLGGNDTIDGGRGSDRIYGGEGKDTLIGGLAEDDTFIFAFASDSRGTAGTRDVIRDFSGANLEGDIIDLSLIDANLGVAGNQAFDFVGTSAFSGAAGELRYYQDAANNRTIIEGNTFADATGAIAEFSVELTGLHNLTAGTLAGFDILL